MDSVFDRILPSASIGFDLIGASTTYICLRLEVLLFTGQHNACRTRLTVADNDMIRLGRGAS